MNNEWSRYLIEWGCGATFTREDPELAAERAIINAMSHVCPLDYESLGEINVERDLMVDVLIGVPEPERVTTSKLASLIPYNCKKNIRVVRGGLIGKGVIDKTTGRTVNVVVAVAFITIYVRKNRVI